MHAKYIFFSVFISVLLFSCSHKEVSQMPTITVQNHSFSNYDSVFLKHIHLNLKVDFNKKSLKGKVVLNIDNPFLKQYLILDSKNLSIEKVLLEDSVETAWSLGETDSILGEALVIEIQNQTKKVAVYYHTKAEAEALMWLEPEQTYGKKHPFLFTQSQAILARTWLPCMDVPSVRVTYSADIQCDKNYLALMSAENSFEKNSKGQYHFEMPQPIPSYLMALAVGDIQFQKLGNNCGVFAEPEFLDQCAKEFEDLPKMIKSAEELYGAYAWGRYDILVLPPSFPFGGMENPRLTFATPTIIAGDKSLVSLVAHELAHSWSGNLVTNSTWDDFWLNEGFTVYFEERIMEKMYGKNYADMLAKISAEELNLTLEDLMKKAPGDTKLKLSLKGRNPDDGVSDIAYIKGSLLLKLIEQKVGRKKWDVFLNQYFNHFKWKSVNTEQFVDYLNQNLLNQFPKMDMNLKEWIYEIGLPKNCPEIISTNFTKIETMANLINTQKQIKFFDTTGFTTHHWLHLLRNLNSDSIKNLMSDIDTVYALTRSTNAEIQCDWYVLCIKNNYTKAFPFIEKYLSQIGRRKFLKPIYAQLLATESGRTFAINVFEKNKNAYHAVSRNTIEKMIAGLE